MMFDIPDERGGAVMDERWGDPKACHFPLVPFIVAAPMPYMALVYAALWLGALGIMLGYKFRISSTLFVICYWYLFLIEKSFWNNHSYLFGLVSFLIMWTQANCYWSLDAWLDPSLQSDTVPYWNYFILKYQFFILYFVAGLKKGSAEWLSGYSVLNLSEHWVFDPFKIFLSVSQTDYLIVHWFAFIFDLTVAFWMMWSRTRHVAMIFCAAFHLMNIRLFKIGMFPWVCLATMPLFYPFNWPKLLRQFLEKHHLLKRISCIIYKNSTETIDSKESCIENRTKLMQSKLIQTCENEESVTNQEKMPQITEDTKVSEKMNGNISTRRKKTTILIIMYMTLQALLPYSHFITKGYNNWTNGLYGYSWDMMVHTWNINNVAIKIVDNEKQKHFYIDPHTWVPNDRWTRHGDMVFQFAHCLKRNILENDGNNIPLSTNLSVYIDVRYSLNGRVQQRMFDPTVDLLGASWSPFQDIEWLMPILPDADKWRRRVPRIEEDVHSWSNFSEVMFAADFPGHVQESYIAPELTNISLTALEGIIAYEPEHSQISGQTMILDPEDSVYIISGTFHKVHNIGPAPAYYMYTFTNKTEMAIGQSPTNKETKPKLPVFTEFVKRIMNMLWFFKLVLQNIWLVYLGCQCM